MNAPAQQFRVHWARVDLRSADSVLFAVWPSPVNADECFRAAGFTDFGDADDVWDEEAESLLQRMVEALSAYGEPRLASTPLSPLPRWRDRLRGRAPGPLPLIDQLLGPMRWDSLPDAIVEFGSPAVSLRGGSGHFLLWITLPATDAERFEDALPGIAGGHPLVRTDLAWEHLLPGPWRSHGGS
ncbi:hypothetical protein [Longimicrobium terrae]|uniref:Uncharacterized protein n=1 Tax=Longimicrobium terrae TaxID=1639882 RepID=A0A841H7K8_9BACT|nr:hypothetical protein [Longimicrobium terrae]MBB4638162.1 hypothetical protein [Longimicrobium terrae]MBB6073679.1 hypothetical protein [Longimicrobium terrae]NNC30357.1 hypothetical protein [Longimicrobium terrae]